jgi:hypothetical protein
MIATPGRLFRIGIRKTAPPQYRYLQGLHQAGTGDLPSRD